MDVGHRHVHLDLVGIFQRDEFGLVAVLFHHPDTDELADAIGNMHDVITLFQIEHAVHGRDTLDAFDPPPHRNLSEDLMVRDNDGIE